MLKSVIKSVYPLAPSDRCFVPAPSIAFRAGGWLAIAGQLRGKGRDRVSAAEPEENIVVRGVGRRVWGVGDSNRTSLTSTLRRLISYPPIPTPHSRSVKCT